MNLTKKKIKIFENQTRIESKSKKTKIFFFSQTFQI